MKMAPSRLTTILSVSCTVLLAALSLADAKELISGEVLEHFRPTQQWHLVDSVKLSEQEPEQFASSSAPQGDILLNGNGKNKKIPYLFTREEYGDVEIHLEYMIPKGSNAGVYVMGRYEVQIFDSYGVKQPKHSDMGGIYQRWRDKKQLKPGEKPGGYEGVPPLVNASKAPGEWQKLVIQFRAPRFSDEGVKIENARFISVYLNEQLVQEDVEMTGPTRSHPIQGEAAQGPVSIQGDHGPIAIRSFQIKTQTPTS